MINIPPEFYLVLNKNVKNEDILTNGKWFDVKITQKSRWMCVLTQKWHNSPWKEDL